MASIDTTVEVELDQFEEIEVLEYAGRLLERYAAHGVGGFDPRHAKRVAIAVIVIAMALTRAAVGKRPREVAEGFAA